jgi:hypothetical protein
MLLPFPAHRRTGRKNAALLIILAEKPDFFNCFSHPGEGNSSE